MFNKKRGKAFLTMLLLMASLGLAACSQNREAEADTTTEAAQSEVESETTAEQAQSETESATKAEETDSAEEPSEEADDTLIRVGSLKGPTTIGLVNMMQESEDGELPLNTEFTMATTADEITAKMVSGDMDIALIPANLASVLYNKTEGAVSVIDINTLGVLYGVTGDESVNSLEDLKGKTVYMTGQGSTPEFALNYILEENGLSGEVNIEFKNEATEIAALLNADPTGTAILPQPFATVCLKQNEGLREFLDLNEEWDKCASSGDSQLLTGVTVVRNDFLNENADTVAAFTAEHAASVNKALGDPKGTAELIVKYGIIEKAPIAEAALPKCNIACITGDEMKAALSGYLEVLYNANPASVGGELPGDDFYAVVE